MKNYYDELEVSKTASKETIEKVYKVLAKKYHPDVTTETDKQAAEEKFKAISEAYEILSDDEKRKKYDLELEQSNPTISYEDYINVVNQRDSLNKTINNLKNEFTTYKNSNNINHQSNDHIPYNQVNSNINNNNRYQNTSQGYSNQYASQNYTNQNTNRNYNTGNSNSNKKTYYYTSTGKPASAFAYWKYKVKQFFSNLGFIILAIFALVLMLNAVLGSNLFDTLF